MRTIDSVSAHDDGRHVVFVCLKYFRSPVEFLKLMTKTQDLGADISLGSIQSHHVSISHKGARRDLKAVAFLQPYL